MPHPLLPRQAPTTLRGFLSRVAVIAIAALIVLGAMDLFEYLHDAHDSHPAPYAHGPAH